MAYTALFDDQLSLILEYHEDRSSNWSVKRIAQRSCSCHLVKFCTRNGVTSCLQPCGIPVFWARTSIWTIVRFVPRFGP
eukprot:3356891-Amphidinium_carterae.1